MSIFVCRVRSLPDFARAFDEPEGRDYIAFGLRCGRFFVTLSAVSYRIKGVLRVKLRSCLTTILLLPLFLT